MSDINEENAPFYEVQKFRQWWLWILLGIPVVLIWWTFCVQVIGGNPFGTNPAPDFVVWILFALFGIGLPLSFLAFGMKTIVKEDRIIIRFTPFHCRTIMSAEIERSSSCVYHPVRDYGGFGIRWEPGRGMVYNVSGNRGVRIELNNGKYVIIGSQRADEMASVINKFHRK